MKPAEIFLSHSDKDRVFADKLTAVFKQHGVPYWFSKRHLRGAQQWHDEIGDALKRCDWFAVVLSPNAVESIWVKRELFYALNQKRLNGKIVPVMFKPCNYDNLSWTLHEIQMIDFTASFEKGCVELLRIWVLDFNPKNHPGKVRQTQE